jgi:hypothetical protein
MWERVSASKPQASFSALSPAATAFPIGRYSSPLDSTANAIRASLFAIATAKTFFGALRSSL